MRGGVIRPPENMGIQITTNNVSAFPHAFFQREYAREGSITIIPKNEVPYKFPISISPDLKTG